MRIHVRTLGRRRHKSCFLRVVYDRCKSCASSSSNIIIAENLTCIKIALRGSSRLWFLVFKFKIPLRTYVKICFTESRAGIHTYLV